MTSGESEHIARIDFSDFYAAAFESVGVGKDFYQRVESLQVRKNDAKIILNQAARMIWLADRIDHVAHSRPAFQILFYLIAAELVAKIESGFEGEGMSKKHVLKFFCEMCSQEHRDRLATAFSYCLGSYISLESTVNLLYEVRCDVVHRGVYYDFSLRTESDGIPLLSSSQRGAPVAEISIDEIRRIVLEGTVQAAKQVIDRMVVEGEPKADRPL